MKTLYLRFVFITIAIILSSGIIAFFLSNIYYQMFLKPVNDEKITQFAKNIATFYEQNPETPIQDYLNNISHLGFQIYLVNKQQEEAFYGESFRNQNLTPQVIQSVLAGNTYHGVAQFPPGLFVTGFFDNELSNTIGVPLTIKGQPHALFVRPDVVKQFGEMRIFFAILVSLMVAISILLILLGTRYIVKPITTLTEATKKIASGNYGIQLNVQRSDEIGKLARHFSKMASSLARLEAMRQEFVSNVSHEIQSPLASIQGFSQTLQSDQQIPPETRQRYLKIIEQESKRISQVSKQLLTLASLDKEERALEKSTFNLAEQIKQAVFMLQWNWQEKDLAIELDLSEIQIHADQKLLHQVWTNLLTNSIKFTESGGTISVVVKPISKKEVQILFKDTGIGIPTEELSSIFDRFYKVDKARKREVSGSGLGLSISKKIIELHGGRIQVESELGRGTSFIIQLPITLL